MHTPAGWVQMPQLALQHTWPAAQLATPQAWGAPPAVSLASSLWPPGGPDADWQLTLTAAKPKKIADRKCSRTGASAQPTWPEPGKPVPESTRALGPGPIILCREVSRGHGPA